MTSIAAVFDENYYLTNNADVVLAISQGQFSNALDHYTKFGGIFDTGIGSYSPDIYLLFILCG